MGNALEVRGLTRTFGGLVAVDHVDFSMAEGERRAIIGPNGAGKTTFFNLVGGQIRASSGDITLFGQPAAKLPPRKRAALGLARTFQSTNLFGDMSAEENVILSLQALSRMKFIAHAPIGRFGNFIDRIDGIFERWDLGEHRHALVKHLSYGVQRQLEIILAMEVAPKLLLLDEPTAGLSPAETSAVTKLIGSLDRTVAVLLIEHDMDVAFEVAERLTVFHQGQVIAEGTSETIKQDPRVAEIYLGQPALQPGTAGAAVSPAPGTGP